MLIEGRESEQEAAEPADEAAPAPEPEPEPKPRSAGRRRRRRIVPGATAVVLAQLRAEVVDLYPPDPWWIRWTRELETFADGLRGSRLPGRVELAEAMEELAQPAIAMDLVVEAFGGPGTTVEQFVRRDDPDAKR